MSECDLGGRFEGATHCLHMRVYYADTDAGGVVYHANYLAFAERARTETLRRMGLDLSLLRRDWGLIFAARECRIDFHRPAYLDDLIEVRSVLRHLGGASLTVAQSIRRDGKILVELGIRLASVRPDGRLIRLPAAVRAILRNYLEEAS
jgi:acyl-CoA thioester hydrolase